MAKWKITMIVNLYGEVCKVAAPHTYSDTACKKENIFGYIMEDLTCT